MSGSELEEHREQLRQSIERNEAELREAVDELTHAVKNELTLRKQIAERPFLWLLGGFGFGLWLGRRK